MRVATRKCAVLALVLACALHLHGCNNDVGEDEDENRIKLLKEKIKVEGAADLVWKYKSQGEKCSRDKQQLQVDKDAALASLQTFQQKYDTDTGRITKEKQELEIELQKAKDKLSNFQKSVNEKDNQIKQLNNKLLESQSLDKGSKQLLTECEDKFKRTESELLKCKVERNECDEEKSKMEKVLATSKKGLEECQETSKELQNLPVDKLKDLMTRSVTQTQAAEERIKSLGEREEAALKAKEAKKKRDEEMEAQGKTITEDDVKKTDTAAREAAAATEAAKIMVDPAKAAAAASMVESYGEGDGSAGVNEHENGGVTDASFSQLSAKKAAELRELQEEEVLLDDHDYETQRGAERLRLLTESHRALTDVLHATESAVLVLSGMDMHQTNMEYLGHADDSQLAYEVDPTGDTVPTELVPPEQSEHLARRITPP